MEVGEYIRTKFPIRSQRTGTILPREGKLINKLQNLGRTLLLVDFGEARKEYLFLHEIKVKGETHG